MQLTLSLYSNNDAYNDSLTSDSNNDPNNDSKSVSNSHDMHRTLGITLHFQADQIQ